MNEHCGCTLLRGMLVMEIEQLATCIPASISCLAFCGVWSHLPGQRHTTKYLLRNLGGSSCMSVDGFCCWSAHKMLFLDALLSWKPCSHVPALTLLKQASLRHWRLPRKQASFFPDNEPSNLQKAWDSAWWPLTLLKLVHLKGFPYCEINRARRNARGKWRYGGLNFPLARFGGEWS